MTLKHYSIPNARVAVHELGNASGEPLIFLHGVPDSGDMWLPVAAHLAGYRCIIPDLPAFGRSTADPGYDLTLANRGAFVEHLLESLEIDGPVTLVAHDHGGLFTAAFAVRHPHRVARLVLMNTLYDGAYKWHGWARIWRTLLLGELSMWMMDTPLAPQILLKEFRRGSGNRGISMQHVHATMEHFSPSMRAMWLRLYRETDPGIMGGEDEQLRQVIGQVPTLVLWGLHDPYLPVELAEKWERAGAEMLRYGEHGHWLMVEAPEKVAAAMAAFFSRIGEPA